MKNKTCCFTGHREITDDESELRHRLQTELRLLIAKDIYYYISGGARGFDLLAAEEVLVLKKEFPHIRLIVQVPCVNQPCGWDEQEKARYQFILQEADEVEILAEHYYRGCMQKRNRRMVEKSAVCIYYQRHATGGTQYTVTYARKNKLLLIQI